MSISARDVRDFGYVRAADVIDAALRGGLDPADDPARSHLPVGADASLFLMPSIAPDAVGVKLVTLRTGNREAGLPAIHGVYVLFAQPSLAPRAVLDGAALTTLRTPAVSVAAVRPLLRQIDHPLDVVVFGAGPQGLGHVEALTAVTAADSALPPVRSVTVVARRDPSPALRDGGQGGGGQGGGGQGDGGQGGGVSITGAVAGSAPAEQALARADVVVCATSSSSPLFDADALKDRSVTIAVGSHDAASAEVEPGFCARATVVVEDVATAVRECGEVAQAVRDGNVRPEELLSLAALARGAVPRLDDAPVLFKGSGMSWQDLVVAHAIAEQTARAST